MTNRPACATASTAARIDPLDGSPHRLHLAHRRVLLHDVFHDVSHQARAPAWSVSLHVHGSERGNGIRRHEHHPQGDSGGHDGGRHQRSSRGAETEHDLPVPASTRRSRRPCARLGWDLPACPGTAPWSPSDPPTVNFQTVPLPATGPLITITTTSTGDGAVDFEFRTLMILAGTTNDVMFRLVDNDTAPTTELRSACMTITAQ